MALTFYLNRENEIYHLTDKQIQEKINRLGPDRYAVEEEIQAEAQALTDIKVNVHIFTLVPFRATAVLGNIPDDWWKEYL